MLALMNVAFLVGHTLLILFNLFGWAFRRTRKLHLLCLIATLFSWIVMGAWYGYGYCLCTDWHFQIRRAMGLQDNVSSYLQLISRLFFGVELTRWTSDVLAVTGLLFAMAATVVAWSIDLHRTRQRFAVRTDATDKPRFNAESAENAESI
jgi:hypothetical protein